MEESKDCYVDIDIDVYIEVDAEVIFRRRRKTEKKKMEKKKTENKREYLENIFFFLEEKKNSEGIIGKNFEKISPKIVKKPLYRFWSKFSVLVVARGLFYR